jgi:arylsulfatase A-like enzyme
MRTYRNVLFIAVDDLRPEINCYGKTKLHTPHLDRLAAGGTLFNHAYCQVPQCMPSRASLMTGVRPDERTLHLTRDICLHGEPTLPGWLKAHGLSTYSVGKVYHYNTDDEASWTRRYTETFYEQPYACDGYCSGYQLEENRRKVLNYGKQFGGEKIIAELPAMSECVDAPDSAYPDGIVADLACRQLAACAESGEAFFLGVGFYRPHLPWATPKQYWDLYDRDQVALAANPFLPKDGIGITDGIDFRHYGEPEIEATYSDLGHYDEETFPVLSEAKQRECVHGYWASVSFTDAQIGKVLDALEAHGLAGDTVVVLWGDNGWHLGEHRLWAKCTHFEESTRVPLVVAAPGLTEGRRSDRLVELLDLYPTLCDLLGLEAPPHLDGRSFVRLLADPAAPHQEAVYARMFDAATVRTERYRYTHYREATPEGDVLHLPNPGNCELFDLLRDPQENVNVAKQPEYASVVEAMARRLEAEERRSRGSGQGSC